VAVSPSASGTPSLLIVTRTQNEAQARETLATAEGPLANLFANTASQAGQAPLLGDVPVGAATVHQLALAPGLELDYTVANRLVVIGTSLSAVSSVLNRSHALAGNPGYKRVLPTHPAKVTSLLYLDFTQLLSIVEQAGLAPGTRFAALRPDLQMIRAAGLQSTSGEDDSTAELYLLIP
jgi:membrane-associated protease RseP (regulator of RpoE activity)